MDASAHTAGGARSAENVHTEVSEGAEAAFLRHSDREGAGAALLKRVQQNYDRLGPRPLGLHDHQKALAVSRDVISGGALHLKELLRRANLQ
jgi:hypothetical protein